MNNENEKNEKKNEKIKGLIYDLKRAERVNTFLEIGRTAIHNGLFESDKDDLLIRESQEITERAIKQANENIFLIQEKLSEALK